MLSFTLFSSLFPLYVPLVHTHLPVDAFLLGSLTIHPESSPIFFLYFSDIFDLSDSIDAQGLRKLPMFLEIFMQRSSLNLAKESLLTSTLFFYFYAILFVGVIV